MLLRTRSLLHQLSKSKPTPKEPQGGSKLQPQYKFSPNQLSSLYHEIHLSLCLLDDLFKCQILDIETMLNSHEVLKKSIRIGGKKSHDFSLHLRRYLEFLRMIKPVSYNNPYVAVSYNNYSLATGSESAGGGFVGCVGDFAYSRAMGHYIISLIRMLENVFDYYLETESELFSDVDSMV